MQAYNAYSEPLFNRLKLHTSRKVYSKGSILLREGEVCRYVYFITKGLLRSYVARQDREVNIWYMKEKDMAAAANSLLLQVPSLEYIEAMENTEVYCLSYQDLLSLSQEFPAFGHMVLQLSWKYYAHFYERIIDLLGATNEERYQYLLEKQPELKKRVAEKYLSSYLGMSDTTMGRVKRNLR